MTTDDLPEFLTLLGGVAEVFDAKFSVVKQQLYFEALKDLDIDDIQRAMDAAVKTCTFMPKPIELRTLAVGDVADHAEEAWLEFRAAQRRVGAYENWEPDDPITVYVVAELFGSWPRACTMELSPEMWASKRKEFLSAYRRNADRSIPDPLCLAGQLALDRGARVMFLSEYLNKKLGTGNE